MDFFRGPAKKNYYDESHERVASVSAKTLKESIDKNNRFQFNITKDGFERQAVCSASFSVEDLAAINRATASRLELLHNAIILIEKINDCNKEYSFKQKSITDIIRSLKYSAKLPDIKLD